MTGKQPVTVSSDASLDSPYTFYFISCKMKGEFEKNHKFHVLRIFSIHPLNIITYIASKRSHISKEKSRFFKMDTIHKTI